MKTDVTFRTMDQSDAIENYVLEKVEKFKKYLGQQDPDATFNHVVLEGNHNHHMYSAEFRLKCPGFNVIVKEEGKEMYPVLDAAIKKMEHELEKAKQKFVDDRRKEIKVSKCDNADCK